MRFHWIRKINLGKARGSKMKIKSIDMEKGKSKMEVKKRRSKRLMWLKKNNVYSHNKGVLIPGNDSNNTYDPSSDSSDDEREMEKLKHELDGVGTSEMNGNVDEDIEEQYITCESGGSKSERNKNGWRIKIHGKKRKMKNNERSESTKRRREATKKEAKVDCNGEMIRTTNIKDHKIIVREKFWNMDQRINHYSRARVISNVLTVLSKEEKICMKNSQFNKFLKFPIKTLPQQILLQLIRRQCVRDNNEELVFKIGNRILRFGLREFAIITGMFCHDYPVISEEQENETNIWNDIFEGKKVIRKRDVEEKFVGMKGFDWGRKIRIKMACLYMLECFVLGKHQKTKINLKTIKLLDTEEGFEHYPWGRIAFDLTISSFSKALTNYKSDTIVLDGFPYAILIWAIETFPDLLSETNMFVRRIRNDFTRMINWKVLKHRVDRLTLDEMVFNKRPVLHNFLEPTFEEQNEEENMEYFYRKRVNEKYKRFVEELEDEEEDEYDHVNRTLVSGMGLNQRIVRLIKKMIKTQELMVKQNEEIIQAQQYEKIEMMLMCNSIMTKCMDLKSEIDDLKLILNHKVDKREEPFGGFSEEIYNSQEFAFDINKGGNNYMDEKDQPNKSDEGLLSNTNEEFAEDLYEQFDLEKVIAEYEEMKMVRVKEEKNEEQKIKEIKFEDVQVGGCESKGADAVRTLKDAEPPSFFLGIEFE